ncbi:MAG: MFS transporter [Planctomycetota bacterium]|jgi:MFS family permease
MANHLDVRLTVSGRGRARRLAYANGAIWAIGNGLISTMLVVYLAMELGVPTGLGISLILAAPRLAGLLRMVAPLLIGRLADRRRFCLWTYALSATVLLCLPFAAAPGILPSYTASLAAMIVLWCVYHLLEYLGTVALWSWLADLVPLRIRGRFFGLRQRWMVAAQAVAMLAAGLFSYIWNDLNPSLRWVGYAIPAGLGACFMMASLEPLARIPTVAAGRTVCLWAKLRSLATPFRDPRFLRLVAFGCWFSFFNGVTQATQGMYPYRVLGIGLFFMLAAKTGMRLGQLTISPWVGRIADRVGNRPVMLVALPIVASGPLWYFLSGPDQPDVLVRSLVAGAWVAWVAYAGLNVCLPNLMLKLSPQESNTPYIAAYFSITGVCYAASTILGGRLFDKLGDEVFTPFGAAVELDYYHYSFLVGWITRTMGVLLLLWVIEPKGPRDGCR